MTEFLIPILSILVGSLVTLIAARKYYERASSELRDEAKELRKLNVLLLRALENAGLAKFTRNDDGNICGMVIELSAQYKVKTSGSKPRLDISSKK